MIPSVIAIILAVGFVMFARNRYIAYMAGVVPPSGGQQ